MLNNYYVSPSSFATKSEFMTGKYATRLGKVNNINTSLFYIFMVFHVLLYISNQVVNTSFTV